MRLTGPDLWRRSLKLLLLAVAGAAFCLPAASQAPDLVLTPGTTLSPIQTTGSVQPGGLAFDSTGNLYLADSRNHVVRRITADGASVIVAGSGRQGFSGDGGPAATSEMDTPMGLATGTDGSIYVADSRNHRVRVFNVGGVMRTIAGTGVEGFSGDGAVATRCTLRRPVALALGPDGSLYVADALDNRVRRIDPKGIVTTVAGDGEQGSSAEGGAANAAHLDAPSGLAFDSVGRLLIADRRNHRIRRMNADGSLETIAGNGALDGTIGASSLQSSLRMPRGVAVDANGNLYLADSGTSRILKADPSGSLTIFAGSGEQRGAALDGAARDVALNLPHVLAAKSDGTIALGEGNAGGAVGLAQGASIDFGSIAVGSASLAQTVLLTNRGSAPLAVSAITVPSGFALMPGSCGALPISLAPGASCNTSILFQPTGAAIYNGPLSFVVLGSSARQIQLQGSGEPVASALLPTTTVLNAGGSVSYTNTPLSMMATVLSLNTGSPGGSIGFYDGSTLLAIVPLTAGGANYSGPALTAGPHSLQARYSGDSAYAPSVSSLQSVVSSASPDFTLSFASAASGANTQTVKAGSSALFQLTLQPSSGSFTQLITFSASGLPPGAIAAFDPVALVPAAAPATVLLTVKTIAPVAHWGQTYVWLAAAICFLLRRRRPSAWSAAIFGLALCVGAAGCGGGFKGGSSQSGSPNLLTYTITITGTALGVNGAVLAHSTVVTLIVN